MQMKWTQLVGLGAVVLASAAGCADRNKDNVPESAATTAETAKATDTVVKKMGNALSGAGKTVENVATGAGKAIEGGANTATVKTAIMNNPSMANANINVDTTQKNTVVLRGTVKNTAQKNLATNLAQKSAGAGYKVVNQLKVSGGAASAMKKKM